MNDQKKNERRRAQIVFVFLNDKLSNSDKTFSELLVLYPFSQPKKKKKQEKRKPGVTLFDQFQYN